MKLSVIAAVYNEEGNIQELIQSVHQALVGIDYEFILVDDGSSDGSLRQMQLHQTARTKIIALRRNYGQSTALAAGIDIAKGQYIATLDADLQNHPTDLRSMLRLIEEGRYDAVVGRRMRRKDRLLDRKLPSYLANLLIRKLTGTRVSDLGCSLKVMRHETAKGLKLFGELHRFMAVLIELQGGVIREMHVQHSARRHGESKYGWSRVLKVLCDLVLILFMQKYFRRPIHLLGSLGLASLLTGGLINLYLLFERLQGFDIWGRPLLILGVLLSLAGLHFLSFGVILEVLVRTYYAAEKTKTYSIRGMSLGNCQQWLEGAQIPEDIAEAKSVRSFAQLSPV